MSKSFKNTTLGKVFTFVSHKFKQLILIVVVAVLIQTGISLYHEAPLPGPLFSAATKVDPSDNRGQPMDGLSAKQLASFREGEAIFKRKFTIKDGLGPLFNGESCFECHGQPSHAVGGEGRDNSSTSIINFARRIPGGPKAKGPLADVIEVLGKRDVDFFLEKGGPSLQRRSITTENPDLLPFEVQIDADMIPAQAEIVSARHSPPVFGDGLIDNIPDSDILANALKQASENPEMAGRPISAVDRYTELPRVGRLGWKNQNVNVLNFTTGAMNIELGLTTWLNQTENSSKSFGIFPMEVQKILPAGPNDKGEILVKLTYFQSLLAPPKRGEVTPEVTRGEKLFEQAKCSVCHIPEMKTAPQGYVIDPDSPLPKLNYLELDCLSDKPVRAYSDFLVHQMGRGLADGFPQEGAKGGEWRTTPLWGLRFKKFYLHDGRTEVLHDAIMAHGGQALKSQEKYKNMSEEDRAAILSFLKSL